MNIYWFSFLELAFLSTLGMAAPRGKHAGETTASSTKNDTVSDWDCSAIGELLKNTGGKVPENGTALRRELEKLGQVREMGVPFSDAPNKTDLINTRVVLAIDEPSSRTPDSRPSLAGKLFFGSNLHWDNEKKSMGVSVVEFISWNERTRQFDFGVIEEFGKPGAKPVLVDKKACMACHKTGGPILQEDNWGNSVNIEVIQEASLKAYRELDTNLSLDSETEIEGTRPFSSREIRRVDELVRQGSALLRANDAVTLLPSGSNREGAVKLMIRSALGDFRSASAQSLLEGVRLDPTSLASFKSDTLRRNTPFAIGEGTNEELVARTEQYNRDRVAGKAKLPPERQPSNPKSFLAPQEFNGLEDLFKEQNIRNGMGLHDNERSLVEKVIDEAVSLHPKSTDYHAAKGNIIEALVNSPEIRPFVREGILPSASSLMSAMKTALPRILKKEYGITKPIASLASLVTNKSACDPKPMTAERTQAPVQHACNRCHSGPGVATRLRLPFDPLDKKSREAWIKNNDQRVIQRELKRLSLYLFETGAMPPSGEPEASYFDSNPDERKSLREFIEREMK